MAKRKSEHQRRSEAAKRGWETRRRRETERRAEAERRRRSEATKKGWETRRRREAERRRRSEAAKKGWETRRRREAERRAEAERQKRSEAAKKGWETRRRRMQEQERRGREFVLQHAKEIGIVGKREQQALLDGLSLRALRGIDQYRSLEITEPQTFSQICQTLGVSDEICEKLMRYDEVFAEVPQEALLILAAMIAFDETFALHGVFSDALKNAVVLWLRKLKEFGIPFSYYYALLRAWY